MVFYVVFLTPNRYNGDKHILNLEPVLKNIRRMHEQGNEHFWPFYIEYWGNIFGNIALFAPFGFLLCWLYPKLHRLRIVFYGLALSILIESIQFILHIGVCDIDDVILNVSGAIIGTFLYRKLAMIR